MQFIRASRVWCECPRRPSFIFRNTNDNVFVRIWELSDPHPHGFVKLQLTDWCHMDYFVDHLGTFLDLDRVRTLAVYGRVRELTESNKNILICAPKMNEGLTGLEWHQGELSCQVIIKEVRTTTYSELVFILQPPGTAASDQCSFFPPFKIKAFLTLLFYNTTSPFLWEQRVDYLCLCRS